MSNDIRHRAYTDRLSDYIDGELDARERGDLDQHLAGCDECRTIVNQLRAIAARAGSLTDRAPDRDLWAGVAARIGQKQPRRFAFTLPQLAAAGIALMVLSGGMMWLARTGDPRVDFPPVAATLPEPASGRSGVAPVLLGDRQYEGAVEDLERILSEGRSRLDPETVRILEQNLKAIDAAIDQSRLALEKDPANTFLNNHLAAAQQRKLALLRRATALTAGS
jgi:hypothetical protein